jgi:hypothetical protein
LATLLCKCGTLLRDDNPDFDYLVMPKGQFDVDLDSIALRGRARDIWRCWTCERLWVFWDLTSEPVEYLRAESES